MTIATQPASEPVVRPPVRWRRFRLRRAVGLAGIALGVAATNLSSTYSLWFLAIGPAVHAIGWLLLPGAPWRRIVVLLPCLLAGLALLAGPEFAGSFAVLLAGWLLVRHRPLVSYLALAVPILASFAFKQALHEYAQNWVLYTVGTAVTVGSAWLAWWLAVRWASLRRTPSQPVRTLR
ncbi:hypothetical protein [Glaciibacter sp. 2TAF33]|uniref:hypothetical protein n=1 Tax=Glaciibacter sp. 2TAF33 TaxID=3233015 RepID=UPI003F926A80